jgi:hypothetical protein
MENINLRESITRTVTYTEVEIIVEGESSVHNVYGKTTVKEQLLKYLKVEPNGEIPQIKLTEKTEKRVISLDNFLIHSLVIEEDEKNA